MRVDLFLLNQYLPYLAQAVLGEASDRWAVLLAVDEVAQVGGTREVRLVLH